MGGSLDGSGTRQVGSVSKSLVFIEYTCILFLLKGALILYIVIYGS